MTNRTIISDMKVNKILRKDNNIYIFGILHAKNTIVHILDLGQFGSSIKNIFEVTKDGGNNFYKDLLMKGFLCD